MSDMYSTPGAKRRRGPDHLANAEAAGRAGAHEVLRTLGVDPTSAESISRWHAERVYLAKSMKGAEDIHRWVKRSAIGVVVTSGLYFAWDALWAFIKQTFHIKGSA